MRNCHKYWFWLLAGLLVAGLACQSSETQLSPSPQASSTPRSGPSAYPDPGATVPAVTPMAETPYPICPTPSPESVSTPSEWSPTPDRYELWLPAVAHDGPEQVEPTPEPTAEPTQTPYPTPVWPEPLAAPGPSKLGLHVIRNDNPWIMEFVRRVRPAVVKAVGDVGWLTEVKRVSPETVTIGRFMPTHQDMNGDPAVAAQAFVAEQLTRYQLNPGVDYWEGWNEPDPNENMDWYAAFEAERVRLLAEHGFKAAVGGFATGVPEWDEFVAFLPAIEAAQQYGGILTLHEYGAPTFDYLVGTPLPGWPPYADRGVLALRYRWWYEEILKPRGLVVPLAITEAGIDGIIMSGERAGPQGLGWRDFSDYWSDIGIGGGAEGYIRQLSWYDAELRRDDYVIGFTIFTAGGGDGWSSYDVNQILPDLALYVAQAN